MLRPNVPSAQTGGIGLVLFYGAMIYLSTQLIDGPIRYSLEAVGGVALIYLRDAIPILMLGVVLGTVSLKGRINATLLFFLVLLVLFSIVALVYVRNVPQILFSLKIVLPFLAGLVCYRELFSDERRLTKFMGMFLFISLAGIYLNSFMKFPWAGLTYEIGNISIEGGFERSTSGFDRMQGFSRTNFEAATHVMLLVVYASIFLRSKLGRVALWIAAGGAILLTTTKGIVATYILLSLFYIVYATMPKLHKLYRALLIVPMCAMVLLPVYLTEIDIDFSDPMDVALYASFYDRLLNGWPPIFENVRENGSIIIGRGVGGTGAGEYYFAADIKGSADNMFVYLYAWFGLASLVLLGILYWQSLRLNILSRRDDLCVFLWLASILVYGISSVIIESAFFAFFFGLCIAHLSQLARNTRTLNNVQV